MTPAAALVLGDQPPLDLLSVESVGGPRRSAATADEDELTTDALGAHRKLVGRIPLKKPCFRIAEINIRSSPSTIMRPRVRSNHEPNPRRSRWLPK